MLNTTPSRAIAVFVTLALIFSVVPPLPVYAANTLSFGAEAVFETGDSTYIDVAALSETTVVISYRDEGNSNRGTAVVGTISGNSITFGTPVVFYSSNASYIAITKLDSDSVVIAYTDVDNDASAIVGDVSGTSIAFHTAAEFTADSTNVKDIARLDDTHFLVAWNNTVGTELDAGVGTVSAGSISYGSTATIHGESTTSISAVGFSATAALVLANDTADGTDGLAHGITVSGGSMTGVDTEKFNLTETNYISAAVLSATRVVVTYFNAFSGVSGLVDFSGGSVTALVDQAVFDASIVTRMATSILVGTSTEITAYRSADSKGKVVVGTISGTTDTYDSPLTFTESSFNNLGAAAISSTKAVIAYQDNSNSGRGTALVVTYGPQSTTSSEGGGGDAAWLIDLRRRNGLDTKGNQTSASASSSSSSASSVAIASPGTANQSTAAPSSSSSSALSSSVSVTTKSSFQIRTCERALKWLRTNPSALLRLNVRLMKHFGFECLP